MCYMQYANDWLKKELKVEDITVSLAAQQTSAQSLNDEAPLLRTRALRLAVLAPVFAVLANRAVVGQTTAVIDLLLEPVLASVSSQQVSWLKIFARMMPTVLAARGNKPTHVTFYWCVCISCTLTLFMTSTINAHWSGILLTEALLTCSSLCQCHTDASTLAMLHALETSAIIVDMPSKDCDLFTVGNKEDNKALQQQAGGSSQPPARRGGILGSTVSAVGQAWMYITDEAAAVAAEGPDGLDKAAQHHQPMPKPHLQFNVISEGLGTLSCACQAQLQCH